MIGCLGIKRPWLAVDVYPMGNMKSSSIYIDSWVSLYQDIAGLCHVSVVESKRDIAAMQRRVSCEGLQFLTVALPRLGKAFDKALLSGTFTAPIGFARSSTGQLPRFLGRLFSGVFSDGGQLRADPDMACIKAVRQLAYFLYKLELPVTPSAAQCVVDAFVKCEEDLNALSVPMDNVTVMAQRLTAAVFARFCVRDLAPKHGPGAVSTGESPAEKHRFSRIYSQIERVYPFTEYFMYSLMHVCDEYHNLKHLEHLDSGTAKVVLVPKDSRGPRLISCEPLEYQWIQQGLGNKFRAHVENHQLTRGQVNFTDQTINRRLALAGSLTQEWVTLDMKEASDRVSVQLVDRLFELVPELLEALMATRSTSTRLPNGTVLPLKKFAPMGSNLCFPVEAFVFYVLAVSAVACTYNLPRRKARKLVYVYGDDLIIHREVYPAVLQLLPAYGLLFNADKCCTSGFFRESCGCDAYQGVDVTPLRLKKVWGHRNTINVEQASSYVALSNAAFSRKYFRLAEYVKQLVERKLGPLPITDCEIGVLSFIRESVPQYLQPPGVRTRFHKRYQRFEVYGCQSRSFVETSDPDNWSTVLRRINSAKVSANLGVYAIPHRGYPKWGWAPI